MLKAECPKCNKIYLGWALIQKSDQFCPECGAPLNITDDSHISPLSEKIDDSIKDNKA